MKKQHDTNQSVTNKEFQTLQKEFRVLTSDFQEFAGFVAENVALKKDINASTEKILTSNDKLFHEVKAMREEQAAHTLRHDRVDETLEDHKHRIKHVEAQVSVT